MTSVVPYRGFHYLQMAQNWLPVNSIVLDISIQSQTVSVDSIDSGLSFCLLRKEWANIMKS